MQDTLAAEWESFEKLIQAGNDEQPEPSETQRSDLGAHSSDCLRQPATGGHATDQGFASKLEVRQKRVFREIQSDSDRNSSSDSEEESRPVLPSVGMNSGSNYKVAQRSSSSDSSQSAGNKLQSKSALSDSDSSSDDEKPAEQTKMPLGECDVLVVCVESNIQCLQTLRAETAV